MNDDTELLLRYVRDRSEPAFVEIVHRHLDGVYSAALRRVGGDAHLAQDVAQKVFVALARKAPALTGHPFLTGWLYTAAKAEAANTVRAEQRRKHREREAHAMAEHDTSSGAGADWSRLSPALDEAIDALPESDRQVVLLRFVNRRRYAEIGAALQLSEDAARMRTNRALEQLRTILQRRGVASTAAALEIVLAENAVGAVPAGLVTAVTNAALAGGATAAGSAAVGASLLGLLASPAALTIAVMAAAVAAAAHENLQARRQETLLAEARAHLAAASAQLRADGRQIAPNLAPRPGPPRPAAVSSSEARVRGDAFLSRHPDVRDALRAFVDAQNRARYGQLFRELGLSAQQTGQLESYLRAGHSMGRMIPGGQIQLRIDDALTVPQANAAIRQLLGDAGYARYRAYAASVQAREAAASLVATLAPTDAPLTQEQFRKMAALYQNHSQKGQTDWPSLLAETREVLSPMQRAALQDLQAEDEANRALQ
ncbi:MAG TPA: sigma-70 family RNA polymerase sigma factor [Opitutaceae bacterium]|nr:sigma-70 family RNA polymerase sigma factor [Opitutaceae bacterium]